MWHGLDVEKKAFEATEKNWQTACYFTVKFSKFPSILGTRDKAQAAQQYLSYDAKLWMGKLIEHAKSIGITYRSMSRCYAQQCELIIEELDELVLNLRNTDNVWWHARKALGDA
ncbi:hypothetical protein N7451_009894 [Penicillium sp. IBT 35674x]|nr:hypothetical protein N7451_009894 [Penicillium sp. IBT 35674x]